MSNIPPPTGYVMPEASALDQSADASGAQLRTLLGEAAVIGAAAVADKVADAVTAAQDAAQASGAPSVLPRRLRRLSGESGAPYGFAYNLQPITGDRLVERITVAVATGTAATIGTNAWGVVGTMPSAMSVSGMSQGIPPEMMLLDIFTIPTGTDQSIMATVLEPQPGYFVPGGAYLSVIVFCDPGPIAVAAQIADLSEPTA